MRKLEPLNQSADCWYFWSVKPLVLQIQVVNDCSNPLDREMSNFKQSTERFERAAISLVTEFDTKHVEWNGLTRSSVAVDCETKPRLRIDEPANEPRRRHAVYAGTWACDPETAPIGVAVACVHAGWRSTLRVLGGAVRL